MCVPVCVCMCVFTYYVNMCSSAKTERVADCLPQPLSSDMSWQSSNPSHCQWPGMHLLLVSQENWSARHGTSAEQAIMN